MPRITISVPNKILADFKREFPEINVAEVARRVITEKIEEFKKLEELKSKGKI